MTHEQQRASRQGVVSDDNTTFDNLAADGTFTGDWELLDYDHVCVDVVTDQAGTLYIDFGIMRPDGTVALASVEDPIPVYAGVPIYVTMSKGAGRAVRVRYENGPVATGDGAFTLQTAFGSNLLPVTASADNEVYTTTTERERDVSVSAKVTGITATQYLLVIDLSDTTNWPHDRTGRIDITSTFLFVDRAASTAGAVAMGVITRIDENSADISFVSEITFNNQSDRQVSAYRQFSPSQLKCDVVDGKTPHILTNGKALGVTTIKTGTTMNSANGTLVEPEVGDIVARFAWTNGSYDAIVSGTYHGER